MAKLEFYRRKDGDWSWRLVSANGRIVATAGEGYRNYSDCHAMASNIIRATVVDETVISQEGDKHGTRSASGKGELGQGVPGPGDDSGQRGGANGDDGAQG